MLNQGYTLQDALNLLEDSSNTDSFSYIRNQLERGILPKDVIPSLCSKKISDPFNSLATLLPFKESLSISLQMIASKEKIKSKIDKKLLYPLLLFFFTLFGMIVFNELCFPTLLTMMQSFQMDPNRYLNIQAKIRMFYSILLLVFFLFVVLYYMQKNPTIKKSLYRFIQKRYPNCFIVKYVSMTYVLYFYFCMEQQIPTKQTIELLKTLNNQPLMQMIACSMEESFLQGSGFEKSLTHSNLDPMLNKFFKIALYSKDVKKMLYSYIQTTKDLLLLKIKRFTKGMQLVCYCMIGFMIIIIYQILMLPLNVINQL